MLRALLWKEWRTQRPLVLAGVGISALLPLAMMVGMASGARWSNSQDAAVVAAILTMLCVWPVFAAAMGATVFGSEIFDGRMQFLMSRPITRSRLWLIKLAAGFGSYLVMLVTTLAVVFAYIILSAPAGVRLSSLLPRPRDLIDREFLWTASVFVLLFACSAYCSMFARRALVAALGGALVAAGAAACIWLAWAPLLPESVFLWGYFIEAGVDTGLPAGALAVLIAGYWMFCRGGIFEPGWQRRLWAPLFVVALCVALVGLVPALLASVRRASELAVRAVGVTGAPALAGGEVVLPEVIENGLSTRLISVAVADGDRESSVAPHGTLPVVSADGDWIAYVSLGSGLGVLSGAADVRVVSADGTDDHVVIPDVPWNWGFDGLSLLIAPNADYVAVFIARSGNLRFAPLRGGPVETVELDVGSRVGGAGIVGWAAASPPTLLYVRHITRVGAESVPARWQLRRFELPTGDDRLVVETAASGCPYWLSNVSGPSANRRRISGSDHIWEWLPVIYPGEARSVRLVLLQTTSGEAEEITDSPCMDWGFSDDGSKFLYARCTAPEGQGPAGRSTELRVRDVSTGADERFAEIRGYEHSDPYGLHLSPDGQAMLMHSQPSRNRRGTYVVRRDGEARLIAPLYRPITWLDATRALVETLWPEIRIAVVDIDTGEIRRIR